MGKTTGKSKSWITTKTHRSLSFHLFKGLVSRIHGSLSKKKITHVGKWFLESPVFERLLLTEELPKNFSSSLFFFFFQFDSIICSIIYETPFNKLRVSPNSSILWYFPAHRCSEKAAAGMRWIYRLDEVVLGSGAWHCPVLEYFFFWVPRTWSFSLKCPLIPIREPLVKKIAC